jgi:hypothetical protein
MSEELKPDVELEIITEPVLEEAEPVVEEVAEPEVVAEPVAVEPVVVPEPPKRGIVPVPVNIEEVIARLEEEAVKPAGPFVISANAEVDTVKVSAIKFKNLSARRSISVYHTQRRLKELGYAEAGADREGFYAEGTKVAMEKFQADKKLAVEGMPNLETLEKLFDGDVNVKVEE